MASYSDIPDDAAGAQRAAVLGKYLSPAPTQTADLPTDLHPDVTTANAVFNGGPKTPGFVTQLTDGIDNPVSAPPAPPTAPPPPGYQWDNSGGVPGLVPAPAPSGFKWDYSGGVAGIVPVEGVPQPSAAPATPTAGGGLFDVPVLGGIAQGISQNPFLRAAVAGGEAFNRATEIGQGAITAGLEPVLQAAGGGPGQFRQQIAQQAGPDANPLSLAGAAGDVVAQRRGELPAVDLPVVGRQDLLSLAQGLIPLPGAKAGAAAKAGETIAEDAAKAASTAVDNLVGDVGRVAENVAELPRGRAGQLAADEVGTRYRGTSIQEMEASAKEGQVSHSALFDQTPDPNQAFLYSRQPRGSAGRAAGIPAREGNSAIIETDGSRNFVRGYEVDPDGNIVRTVDPTPTDQVSASASPPTIAQQYELFTKGDLSAPESGLSPAATAPGEVAGNINLGRASISPEARQIITETSNLNPEFVPPTQTHVTTEDLAQNIVDSAQMTGQTPNELVRNLAAKGITKPEEAVAIRMSLANTATKAAEAAIPVADAVNPTAEQLANAERAILAHLQVQDVASATANQAGKLLDSYNIIVNAPNGHYTQALDKLGQLDRREQFVKLLATIPKDDTARISDFARQVETALQKQASKAAAPVDWQWWLGHVYVNGIMSGLSNIRNALGNATKIGKTVAEVYGAAGLERGRTLAGGTRNTDLAAANSFANGLFTQGLGRGAAEAAYTFKNRATSGFTKLDSDLVRYPQNPVGARIADVIGLPGRGMLAADSFFKGMLEEGFKGLLANNEAVQKGLTGQAKTDFVANAIANPDIARARQIRDLAAEYTYNAPAGAKTTAVRNIRDAIPGAKLLVPFINTPANIYRDAIQSTPLGLPPMSRVFNAASGGKVGEATVKGNLGQAETAMRYSRAILGSTGMAAIYSQMLSGNITGLNPYTPGSTEWDIWNKDNVELGVKNPLTGQTVVSMDNMPPFSTVARWSAAMVAAGRDLAKKGADPISPDFIKASALRLARTSFDESFFSQMSDAMNAVAAQNPEPFLKNIVRRVATAPIPYSAALSLANHIGGSATGGDVTRDPQNWYDYVTANLPILSKSVQPKLTELGAREPSTNTGALALLPQRVVTPHADEMERELLRLKDDGFAIPEPVSGALGKAGNLTPEALYQYRSAVYPQTLDAVQKVMNDPKYGSKTDQEKHAALASAINDARDNAKEEFAWNTLLARSTTPQETAQAALLGLQGNSKTSERTLWLDDVSKSGKLTPEAARLIDAQRTSDREPSVAEYLKAAPDVRTYLAIKPYAVDDATLQRDMPLLHQRKDEVSLIRMTDPQRADLIEKTDPLLVRYRLLVNPFRSAFLKTHPLVDRFVSGDTYEPPQPSRTLQRVAATP